MTIVDISIARGDAKTLKFTCKDEAGAVVDITGWTIKFTVSRRRNSATKMIEPISCALVLPASGTYKAILTSDDTDIEPADYFWDTRRTDPGLEETLGSGEFTITAIAQLPEAP